MKQLVSSLFEVFVYCFRNTKPDKMLSLRIALLLNVELEIDFVQILERLTAEAKRSEHTKGEAKNCKPLISSIVSKATS